jgi:hypothetical protein
MYFIRKIILFLCLLELLPKCYNQLLCNHNSNCNICQYCGSEIKNYTSCFYYNIFCKNNSNIIYSPTLKKEYKKYFESSPEIYSFCGQKEYILENIKDNIIIFTNRNKSFPKNKYIHCNYLIKSIN